MRGGSSNSPPRTAAVPRESQPLHSCPQLQADLQQLPGGPCASEDELLAACSSSSTSGCLTEPGFDTNDAAVFPPGLLESQREAIVWRRMTGPLVVPSRRFCRLVQGGLSPARRWLLGAMAAVAARQLLKLIVSDEHAARGLFTFQLCLHGRWQQVTMDNRLPCLERQQRLAFCSSATPQELWPSLLEKAYARAHGGYAALAAGDTAAALADLTGGFVTTLALQAADSSSRMSAGVLWQQLVHQLAAGSMAVCQADKEAADSGPGVPIFCPVGALPGAPYSIIAAKELPCGTQLLRLHNPWAPEGVLQGACWAAPDAKEWGSAEGQAALAADPGMQEGLQDPATFWCCLSDFMQVFSTLWLVHMPSGGQLVTLTASWPQQQQHLLDAASAASSPLQASGQASCRQAAAADVLQASSPQFRLLVASTCEVVLRLSQVHTQATAGAATAGGPLPPIGLKVLLSPQQGDSWLQHGKALAAAGFSGRPRTAALPSLSPNRSRRRNSCGSSPARPGTAAATGAAADSSAHAGGAYRCWQFAGDSLLADTGLSSSRDVVLRFRAEQGRTYTLVPRLQGRDSVPFVLQAHAPRALQLEQLPPPFSLSECGAWRGQQAGGRQRACRGGCPTPWSGPQLLVSCARQATVLALLSRPDVVHSLLTQPHDPAGCIGITACEPGVQGGAESGPATTRCRTQAPGRCGAGCAVLGMTDSATMDAAVLALRLQPHTPVVLVPTIAEAGGEAPYELQLLSSRELTVNELPPECCVTLHGSWEPGNAGGCELHASWASNPAFALQLERAGTCTITLTRDGGHSSSSSSSSSRSSSGSSSRRRRHGSERVLDSMVGFSLLRLQDADAPANTQPRQGRRHAPGALQQLHEAVHVPMRACEASWELPGGVALVLVPSTYAPGVVGGFTLAVAAPPAAAGAITLQPIEGGLAAAHTLAAAAAAEAVGSGVIKQ